MAVPHRISKIIFALGADEFLAMPEGKTREAHFFRVQSSVSKVMGQCNFSGQRDNGTSLQRDGPEESVKILDRSWDETITTFLPNSRTGLFFVLQICDI